uniref:protein-serine/threonine phosphatase n=1 Tax=Hordeum vulgare subsp. vulgare TaxID=112509 RepID=A0A8I6YYE5_HORVV
MANAGVNNVPAAVELGADDPALASVEGEVESPPPSSGYNASSEGSEEYLTSGQEGEGSGAVPAPLLPAEAAAAAAAVWSLAFGSASERGQDHGKRMEDAVSLRPFFCAWADGSPMHFFAVFDGHGGPQVRIGPVQGPDARHTGRGAGRRGDGLPEGAPGEEGRRGGASCVGGGAEAELRAGGRTGDGAVGIGMAHRRVHCRGGARGPG